MKHASELRQLSDERESKRKQYWKEHDEVVDMEAISKINEGIQKPVSIYSRGFTYVGRLGKASVEYLKSLGYTVSGAPTTQLDSRVNISW